MAEVFIFHGDSFSFLEDEDDDVDDPISVGRYLFLVSILYESTFTLIF